jgi:hypothetical protein
VNVKNNKVLDVQGGRDAEGQNVLAWKKHNGANQRWRIVYIDSVQDQTKGLNKEFGFFIDRPFYIVNRMPMRRVVECQGNARTMLKRLSKGAKNQLFTFDGKTKTIYNMQWTTKSLTIGNNGNNDNNKDVFMTNTNARWM